MANSGAKKRKTQNEKELLKIRLIMAATTIPYILYRVVYQSETFGGWLWFAYLSINALNLFAYYIITSMCKLTYDNNGELIDGGADLNQGGMTEYYFDIVYVCSIIQGLGLISDKCLYLVLVIPIFAVFKIWKTFIGPFLASRNQQQQPQEEKSKRREKMEKKQDKQKVKFVR
ncbi:hypothetical protein RB653_005862 [Dictyostelium firmibasis]|uniref:Transmembrane protein 208 homolog n=1 Tax=Dictyostelium firmibasis TaxID=79012 RepID=A0AAN7YTB7_9MYCE